MNVDTCDENTIFRIVGAVIGALIGYVLWLFCGYYGIIPGIVGFAFAYLTIRGYILLAGSISRRGLIICIVISVLLVSVSEIGAVCLHIYFDRNIHAPLDILNNIPVYIREENIIWRIVGNTFLGIFSFFVGCFSMFFKIWMQTSKGPDPNVKIDNRDDFFEDFKNMERKDIPIKGNIKWVILMIIAALLFVTFMTIWEVGR